MALTLTADILAEARVIPVTGTVPASVEPGYRFALDDELLEFTTFELRTVQFSAWIEELPNPQRWYVVRGQGGTVPATHSAGTAIKAVLGALVAAADDDPPPDPFASPGGSGIPQGGPLTEDLDADGHQIGGLPAPSLGDQAANKDYVDGAAGGFEGWTSDEANPANVDANGGALTVGTFKSSTAAANTFILGDDVGVDPAIRDGTNDPSAGGGLSGVVGSVFLRNVGGGFGTGQAWLKTGAGNTDWTQIGGISAAALKTVRVPIAFDDTPVTPFTVYTPAAGEAIIWKLSYISVTDAFDGTTPGLALTFTDFAGTFNSFSLETADSASSDGHTLTPLSTLDVSSDVGYFPDTDPILGILSDGANGDPNDPTPLTTGAAELVLVIVGL